MHEYSIVASLIDLCEKEAHRQHAKAIKTITLKVGRLSGIEPHLLTQCFDTFKEETLCHNAILELEMCDVVIFCATCKEKSVITNNNFICPLCHSEETSMVGGQELLVQSIEIVEDVQ